MASITIKKGSKGEAVKQLQSLLGLTPDGIFGEGTEKAVKKWQSEHGLTPDGIVGPATLAKMTTLEAYSSKAVDSCVIYKPINVHITSAVNRPIKYIAIHFTAGSRSVKGTASNIRNVFIERAASADFIVDDGSIVQVNPDLKNYYCWAVGDRKNIMSGGGQLNSKATNRNTISIEICSTLDKGTTVNSANHNGWHFTVDSLNNAVKLTKILMRKYNIPIENVVRHYDITGKLCPGIPGWNDGFLCDSKTGKQTNQKNNSTCWVAFKNRLQ